MQLTKGAIGNLINRYKAVLKKCHLMNTFGSLAVAGMLVMGGAGVAGAANTPSEVTIPLSGGKTVNAYNGQPATLSDGSNGKHIFVGGTINNIKSLDPHTHFGTFTDPTSITVTEGAYNWDIYAGSLAVADGSTEGFKETSATSGSTKLVINGGTFEGAELAGGGSASASGSGIATAEVSGSTDVTINSYVHEGTGIDYIMAGNKILTSGKGQATGTITGDTNLTISPADGKTVTTTAVVLGGSGVRVSGGTAAKASDTINGNTNVTINGGTLAGVVGGSIAEVLSGTGTATATVKGNSTVTIIDGTIDNIKFGSNIEADPSVVGGSMAYGAGASAANKGNTLVAINDGTINDKVLGGSLALKGGEVTVGTEGQNNTSGIVVENVSKVGDLVGGNMAEGGTATLNGSSFVEVKAGKVEGDVMGGSYVRGSGTVTTTGNTGVVFSADNNATVKQAEYLVGGDKVLASSENATSTGTISGTSSVTVNGNASVTTGAVVGGSFSRVLAGTDNRAASATVANSVVTINGGKSIAGVVGGGLAEHLSGNGSATSTVTGTSAVYVNDGNLTNIVYTTEAGQKASSSAAVAGAGFATGQNATASVGNSVVVIDGADTVIKGNENTLEDVTYDNQDSAKVVAGGVAINGGTVSVANTSLTMKDGKVTGDLVGGNLLEKDGEEQNSIASTTVNVEGGTVAGEIYGGSYVRNTAATSNVNNTTVNISGGTIGATEPQGWAQYVVAGGKAMSNATETTSNVLETAAVNISGGDIMRGAVVGGGFARAQGAGGSATANVEDSVVNLTGGSLVGVVGGGLAENLGTTSSTATATAEVTTASLTIDGNATVNGIIYKGNDAGNTSPSAAVIGGGLAYSKNGSKATASVGTANTIINGGTINGDVYAGGMADGANAQANVDNASLTIKGNADIQGNIHAGGYALNGGNATVNNATVTFDGNSSFAGKVFGQGHADSVSGSTATVTNSTLAFTNYTGEFKGAAYGFGTISVAEGSTVKTGAVVSGQQGDSPEDPKTGFFGAQQGTATNTALTIKGGGTITAGQFHVSTNSDIIIEHGNVVADEVQVQNATLTVGGQSASASLTVNEELKIDGTHSGGTSPSITVANLGTVTLGKNVVLDENGELQDAEFFNDIPTNVTAGGTLKIDGLNGMKLTEAQLQYLQGLTSSGTGIGGGLLDLGGADLGVTPGPDGTVSYDEVQGITSASLKDTIVAVNDTQNMAGISGGFKNVQLTEDATELKVNGTLQLAGSTAGGNLVATNGDTGDLDVQNNSVATLGREDANNQGTLGDVTLNDSGILNVIGQGRAEFMTGYIASTGGAIVNVSGATLNTQQIAPTNGLSKLNITNGAVHAAGDVKVKDLALAGGLLTAVAQESSSSYLGSITITNSLSGQGVVDAAKKLELTSAYTGADTDALALQANELITAAFDSEKGDVTISAATWTSGATTLKGDAVELTKAGTFTDTFAMDGGTLVAQSGDDANLATLTFQNNATFTNGAVAVVDSIKMAVTGKTLTVGTGDDTVGGTTLSARHIDLNGGMLLVDPDWVLPSSNVAVESMGTPPTGTTPATYDDVVLNGRVGVGQNSYLALGTDNTTWLPGVVAGYTNGVGLSETGITAALGVYKGITIGSGEALLVDGSKVGDADGTIPYDPESLEAHLENAANANSATFGANSLLVINGAADGIAAGGAAITFENTAAGTNNSLTVADSAKLLVTDAVAGQTYTIVGNVNSVTGVTPEGALPGWKTEGLSTTTDMISLGDAVFDGTNNKVTTTASRNDAHTVFPNLSDGMADAVNDLYTGHDGATAGDPKWDYADVNSADMGVRFLSRATDNRFLGSDKDAAAATIESAARIAFAGAVPQMTKMASDAGTNAVVNRLGFANPADGAQAMDAEGKIVDRNTTGFALWIAPLWQSQHGWGMEADNLDYGFNGNLGGVSLGADYTFENAIRAGITFNIGGGYAESSGGDLNSTENRMSFWGLGAYAGWNYENFGLMADVSYTSTWNDLKQDMDSRMGMGDLEADVQASAISAGLRAEYKLETSVLDVIPHIGVRYMSLNTWGFDAESNGGTVLEGDGFHQDIWTFPIGVTFTKDFTLDSGWSFKPSIDFSVIPAAGDIKAKQDVAFTGLPSSYEVETQMMDYLTWQGGVGLEMGNDTMSFGVNYTLQAGQHTTGHGVFGSFRYEF